MKTATAALWAIGILVLGGPSVAQSDFAIPILVVDAGRAPSAREVAAVAAELASPSFRGEDLRARLGLLAEPEEADILSIAAKYKEGLDRYFDGNHDAARETMRSVLEGIIQRPVTMSSNPDLRRIAFDSAIYLAMLGDDTSSSYAGVNWLERAARRFPDLAPAPADFPPWIRDEFERIRSHIPSAEEKVLMEAPPGCELVVEGRVVDTTGGAASGLGTGPRSMRARCHGRLSPISLVEIGEGETRYRPILLSRSKLSRTGEDVVLEMAPGSSDGEILDDVLSFVGAGGWNRSVVLVGRPGSLVAWLVDADLAAVVRSDSQSASEPEAADRLALSLLPRQNDETGSTDESEGKKKWYGDGAAWTLVGVGLAAAGAGLALGQVYGKPSAQEPAAWALMAGGGAIVGTGVVLFAIPSHGGSQESGDRARVTLGAAGTWTF